MYIYWYEYISVYMWVYPYVCEYVSAQIHIYVFCIYICILVYTQSAGALTSRCPTAQEWRNLTWNATNPSFYWPDKLVDLFWRDH